MPYRVTGDCDHSYRSARNWCDGAGSFSGNRRLPKRSPVSAPHRLVLKGRWLRIASEVTLSLPARLYLDSDNSGLA
jgi:hypothetical protein